MHGIFMGEVQARVTKALEKRELLLQNRFYQQHLTTGEPLADILVAQRTSMAEALLSLPAARTVAIIGAGPIGLELAVAFKRASIDYVQFDAAQIGAEGAAAAASLARRAGI